MPLDPPGSLPEIENKSHVKIGSDNDNYYKQSGIVDVNGVLIESFGGTQDIRRDLIEPTDLDATAVVSGDFLTDFEVTNAFTKAGGSGQLDQITLISTAVAPSAIDVLVWLFEDEPTQSLSTGDPLNIADAEMEKLITKVAIRSGSVTTVVVGAALQVQRLGIDVWNSEATPGTSLFVVVSSLGAFTPAVDSWKWKFAVRSR